MDILLTAQQAHFHLYQEFLNQLKQGNQMNHIIGALNRLPNQLTKALHNWWRVLVGEAFPQVNTIVADFNRIIHI